MKRVLDCLRRGRRPAPGDPAAARREPEAGVLPGVTKGLTVLGLVEAAPPPAGRPRPEGPR